MEKLMEHFRHVEQLIGYGYVGISATPKLSLISTVSRTHQAWTVFQKFPDLVAKMLRQAIIDEDAREGCHEEFAPGSGRRSMRLLRYYRRRWRHIRTISRIWQLAAYKQDGITLTSLSGKQRNATQFLKQTSGGLTYSTKYAHAQSCGICIRRRSHRGLDY
jgi:hypothetical protein